MSTFAERDDDPIATALAADLRQAEYFMRAGTNCLRSIACDA